MNWFKGTRNGVLTRFPDESEYASPPRTESTTSLGLEPVSEQPEEREPLFLRGSSTEREESPSPRLRVPPVTVRYHSRRESAATSRATSTLQGPSEDPVVESGLRDELQAQFADEWTRLGELTVCLTPEERDERQALAQEEIRVEGVDYESHDAMLVDPAVRDGVWEVGPDTVTYEGGYEETHEERERWFELEALFSGKCGVLAGRSVSLTEIRSGLKPEDAGDDFGRCWLVDDAPPPPPSVTSESGRRVVSRSPSPVLQPTRVKRKRAAPAVLRSRSPSPRAVKRRSGRPRLVVKLPARAVRRALRETKRSGRGEPFEDGMERFERRADGLHRRNLAYIDLSRPVPVSETQGTLDAALRSEEVSSSGAVRVSEC